MRTAAIVVVLAATFGLLGWGVVDTGDPPCPKIVTIITPGDEEPPSLANLPTISLSDIPKRCLAYNQQR